MTSTDSVKTVRRVTSIRGTLLAGASACVLLLGGFSAWAFSVPLSGAIIAQGTVITDGSVQVVRHERGGVLAALAIREGEPVRKGAVLATLKATPHRGSLRDEIAPGLRAIPAGRKAVIAFAVDDDVAEVLIYAVTYGGADWAMRSSMRSR